MLLVTLYLFFIKLTENSISAYFFVVVVAQGSKENLGEGEGR